MSSKSLDRRHRLPSLESSRSKVRRSFSKASSACSDDESDGDGDEDLRRKYISLNAGQTLSCIWPLPNQINVASLVVEEKTQLRKNSHSLFSERSGFSRSSMRHVRNSSSPSKILDRIQLNNDFEYGFNPLRPKGSKSGNTVRLRPLSLYSPQPVRSKSTSGNAFTPNSGSINYYRFPSHWSPRRASMSPQTTSYAQTDLEAKLELEIHSIRSQPSDINLQGWEGKHDKDEMLEDRASARRRRFVRRQLSFKSQRKTSCKKSLSLDSGLASDRFCSKSSQSFSSAGRTESSKSVELLSSDAIEGDNCLQTETKCEVLDCDTDLAREIVDDEVELEVLSDVFLESGCDSNHDIQMIDSAIKLAAQPEVDGKPLEVENILQGSDSHDKPPEKNKRRGSIPQILSAFKLPNKRTFKKLIRRKAHDANTPVKADHEICPDVDELSSCGLETPSKTSSHPMDASSEIMSPHKIQPGSMPRSCSVDSSDSQSEHSEKARNDKSISVYSLPKLDEDKEVVEFDSPLERKSRSSCSLALAASYLNPPQQEASSSLERRMSDTALSWNKVNKTPGCSPGKRFMHRILSPIVCGLPPLDKYGIPHADSFHSLLSCDSSSVVSDCDSNYPHLFDFSSQELVEEMTLIDKELLVRIPWEELALCGWMSTDKYSLAFNVMTMVEFFNRIAMLVATTILAEETSYLRAKVIKKVIKLAIHCRRLQNFNSLKAVLGGLQCTPIFRLKATWRRVPARFRRIFQELSELMAEDNNFLLYRRTLKAALIDPPCLPFLGNFLTQVAHTQAYMAVQVPFESGNNKVANASNASQCDEHGSLLGKSASSQSLSLVCENQDCVDGDCVRSSHIDFQEPSSSLSASEHPGFDKACSHTRTDSDDSGVVLNIHRLSHTDEDATSPEESGVSSPEDDRKTFQGELSVNCNGSHEVTSETGVLLNSGTDDIIPSCVSPRSKNTYKVKANSAQFPGARLSGLDNRDDSTVGGLEGALRRRPCMASSSSTGKQWENELTFWKYQIAAIQYRFPLRPMIRRFLLNTPYNTEEDNYRLSLQKEPKLS